MAEVPRRVTVADEKDYVIKTPCILSPLQAQLDYIVNVFHWLHACVMAVKTS